MVKNKSSLLFTIGLLSVLPIFILHYYAVYFQKHKNNFIRHFQPHFITNFKVLDLKVNSFTIAGIAGKRLFLGNLSAPTLLFSTDKMLVDTQTVYLPVPRGIRMSIEYVRAQLLYPNIFLIDEKSASYVQNILPSFQFRGAYDLNIPFLEDIVAISSKSFVFKTYNPLQRQSILLKKTAFDSVIRPHMPLLVKQVDGHFCVDGQLLFSPGSSQIVFVYYYRNQFLCMDSNINLQYKGKTIDTNSLAKINIDSFKSSKDQRSVTFSRPPLLVNRTSCVYMDKLYINSALMADNESKESFEHSSVIDIYDLRTNEYIFSFYMPDIEGRKIRQFQVFDNAVVAVQGNSLVRYDLNLDTFH